MAGIVVTSSINPWKNWQSSSSNLRDADGNINTYLISDAYNANKSRNINTNFNYKHTFDSTGREISVDLDYGYYKTEALIFSIQKFSIRTTSREEIQFCSMAIFLQIIKIYTAKTDYVHPFNKNVKLEAGLKTGFVNTDNNVLYQRDTTTGWKSR